MTAAALNHNLSVDCCSFYISDVSKKLGRPSPLPPPLPPLSSKWGSSKWGNHIFSAYFFIWSLLWLHTSMRKVFLTTVLCLNFVWGNITLSLFYAFWNLCYRLRKAFPRMGKIHLLLFLLIFYCFLFYVYIFFISLDFILVYDMI